MDRAMPRHHTGYPLAITSEPRRRRDEANAMAAAAHILNGGRCTEGYNAATVPTADDERARKSLGFFTSPETHGESFSRHRPSRGGPMRP